MSENINAALAKFQGEVPPIPRSKTVEVRTKTGGRYTFAYAPHEVILGVIREALANNNLAAIQPLADINGRLAIWTILTHSSGERIESLAPVPTSEGMSPQEIGSAITYMRRYALSAILGLATEEDDDGNHASGNSATEQNGSRSDSITTEQLNQAVAFAAEHGSDWATEVAVLYGDADPALLTVEQAQKVFANILDDAAKKKAEA